ncbi:NAD(P)-dependent oxidoreductase [Microlunatus speluncae]|uniref:NAD(P)-dependent oxidoreductase n=1 Tax=Microlunatus speluncae TaxID=2594267 RepID=UPI001266401D|nr:SDR family oxidoreductase [Microlunatus speluncae]
MNLAVFGATGTVGRLVVEQALAAGHQVTAVTRSRTKITTSHEHLRVVEADPLDPDQVTPALAGTDAVIIAIGGGAKGGVRGPSTVAIIEAMQRAGVRRLICQSTLGTGDSRSQLNFWWKYVMFGLLLRRAYADHELQEDAVRRSGLDWTIVRPSAFTDGPRTSGYHRDLDRVPGKLTLKISRADVAEYLVGQLTDDSSRFEAVGISY